MKTIYLANHAQFEGKHTNLGDWAIFEQMIAKLKPYIDKKKYRVIVASAEPEFTQLYYPVIAFQRGGVSGILNSLKWLWKSDVIIIGGGEIIQDLSSLVYIPYQLIRPLIGKIFGKKLYAYAIGVGESWEISGIGRLQAKLVLNLFDVITVRDEKSYYMLKDDLKIRHPQLLLSSDPAINLQEKNFPSDRNEKYAVMSVRSVYHRTRSILPFSIRKKLKLLPKEYYQEIDTFKSNMAEMATYIIQKYEMKVLFLNTYTGKSMSANDDEFSLDVINRIPLNMRSKVEIIGQNLFPCQIKGVLARAQIIISVPLHPLILGASEGVPVMSFAYASKSMCFMKEIGMDKYIYPVVKIGDRVNMRKVIEDLDGIFLDQTAIKEKIHYKVSILKKRERKNFVHMIDLVEK